MSLLIKDANGNIVSTPGFDPAYGASCTAQAYVTAMTFAQLKGPTTGVARVKRVTVTMTVGAGQTAGDLKVQLVKQSTANTVATSVGTPTPLNSTSSAATSIFSTTSGSTLGTVTGTAIRSARLGGAAAAGPTGTTSFTFDFSHNLDQAPVLNSASEYLGIEVLNGTTTPTGAVLDADIEWEEASA